MPPYRPERGFPQAGYAGSDAASKIAVTPKLGKVIALVEAAISRPSAPTPSSAARTADFQ